MFACTKLSFALRDRAKGEIQICLAQILSVSLSLVLHCELHPCTTDLVKGTTDVFIEMLQVSTYSTIWQTTKNVIGLLLANMPAEVVRLRGTEQTFRPRGLTLHSLYTHITRGIKSIIDDWH